ncbi:MAG: hypothetical protein TH68_00005 [Candidatus Synechococcus spongiarum 142]|uniref:Transposase n=1 Tax=Candidatus Synechococcus spongiarum 142 TaxID=1608213 RepID=A0A6N3X5X6_9SYNE|nr:MAG: hypothetical protein TH68_00005 [Candidatus Synechococcus spongiarum 142]
MGYHFTMRKSVVEVILMGQQAFSDGEKAVFRGAPSFLFSLFFNVLITQKSAYFLVQRLREAWSDMPFNMKGPVEVDVTYFGVKRQNIFLAKRQ